MTQSLPSPNFFKPSVPEAYASSELLRTLSRPPMCNKHKWKYELDTNTNTNVKSPRIFYFTEICKKSKSTVFIHYKIAFQIIFLMGYDERWQWTSGVFNIFEKTNGEHLMVLWWDNHSEAAKLFSRRSHCPSTANTNTIVNTKKDDQT